MNIPQRSLASIKPSSIQELRHSVITVSRDGMTEQEAREKDSFGFLSFNSLGSMGKGKNPAKTIDWEEHNVIRARLPVPDIK